MASLTCRLVYSPLQYGTFTYQEVATCAANNSEIDVPIATGRKALTFIYGELCLRIPQFYRQRFSTNVRLAATLEASEASIEAAHSLHDLNYMESEPSCFFWTQIESQWRPFVERCRQEWLDIHAFGVLITG